MPENIFYESEARGSSRPAKPKPREANPRQSSLPTDGPRLHRRRRVSNQLYVDPRIIPEGYTYEWKAESIYGQPNTEHMVELRENHWRAVPVVQVRFFMSAHLILQKKLRWSRSKTA